MKTTILLLLAAGLAASIATAADSITDTGTFVRDGKDLGPIPNVLNNKLASPSEVQAAIIAKLNADNKAVADAQSAAVTAAADKLALAQALKDADAKTGPERDKAISDAIKQAKQDAKAKLIAERQAARDAAQAALDEAKK